MLAEGGNAVDACVAAAFAGWVAESPLTGPGRGRLRPRPPRRRAAAADRGLLRRHAGARPAGGRRAPRCTRSTSASAATARRPRSSGSGRPPAPCPGAAAGLAAVHEAYGSLPWAELLQPAIELAREGVELSRPQAHLHAILDLILRHAPEGTRLYSRADGSRLQPGDVLRLPDLGETLDAHRRGGSRRRSTAATWRARPPTTVAAGGGKLTADDLAAYRVVWRRAGSRLVSRARGDLEPAAVVGRHPDRLRARAARARRAAASREPPRRSPRSPR